MKVWWKYKYGHEWEARIQKRSIGRECPECQKFNRTSFPEFIIFYYIHKYYPDAINSYKAPFLGTMELDIYIPSLKVGIEYDGVWHIVERDIDKDRICENNGITLIRVRLSKVEAYERKDPIIISEDNSPASIEKVLNELFPIIGSKTMKFNVGEEYQSIVEKYRDTKISNNLAEVYPGLAEEWHPIKNGNLKPENIPAVTSSTKYWWKCSKCGYEWRAQLNNRINRRSDILIECCIGDVPQRISNFRCVKKCEIIESVLVIFTEVKSQEEMDLIDEE